MRRLYLFLLTVALAATVGLLPLQAQTSGYFLHTVAKGQSLYSIAHTYNVAMEEIVRLNPGSDSLLRSGQVLKIPQTATADRDSAQRFHTIQAGETLYQLTVKYQVSAQAICAANPGLSASNFRVGQVVVIPPAAPDTDSRPTEATATVAAPTTPQKGWREMHRVARKETVFSISQLYGISQEELIAANPELRKGKLKKGSLLFIPYPKSEQGAQERPVTQTPTVAPSNEELFDQSREVKKSWNPAGLKVALLLPFTDTNGAHGEEQIRMLEFYEGFLMAADSLKRQGVSMDIYTYDTKGNVQTVKQLLANGTLKEMDIIFGPNHAASMQALAEFARQHHIRVVNSFSNKVDQVFNNPYVYQVNTPQSYLYSEVYEHFIRKFGQANVVFLSDGMSQEKKEFLKGMKDELKTNGIAFRQVQVNGEVDGTKIIAAMDTLRENIFIPTSGTNTALIRLLPHLTLVRREHPHFDMHLFGYPEWQTYTSEHLASFYELDTYFYSSFYTNNLFPEAIRFIQNYRRWFSKDMRNTFPKYGMLGFDTGYFFLKGLSEQGSGLDDRIGQMRTVPIQTGLKFERVNNWGGFINRKVFFIRFSNQYELIKLDFE